MTTRRITGHCIDCGRRLHKDYGCRCADCGRSMMELVSGGCDAPDPGRAARVAAHAARVQAELERLGLVADRDDGPPAEEGLPAEAFLTVRCLGCGQLRRHHRRGRCAACYGRQARRRT